MSHPTGKLHQNLPKGLWSKFLLYNVDYCIVIQLKMNKNTLVWQFVAQKSSDSGVGLTVNGYEFEYLQYGDFSFF